MNFQQKMISQKMMHRKIKTNFFLLSLKTRIPKTIVKTTMVNDKKRSVIINKIDSDIDYVYQIGESKYVATNYESYYVIDFGGYYV